MALLAPMRIVHTIDPRQSILDDVGRDIDSIEVLNQYVLIGKYLRPADAKTEGGVYLSEKAVEEDRYQTKVGLVLKLGSRAFVDDPEHNVKFYGFSVYPGQWVGFKPSDGLTMQVGKHECRLVPDVHIKLRLKHPDAVF